MQIRFSAVFAKFTDITQPLLLFAVSAELTRLKVIKENISLYGSRNHVVTKEALIQLY